MGKSTKGQTIATETRCFMLKVVLRMFVFVFVAFKMADGSPIYINAGEIIAFHKPTRGIAPKSANTQIKVHDVSYYVRETVEEVAAKLKNLPPDKS
jgi:hypothetical protein